MAARRRPQRSGAPGPTPLPHTAAVLRRAVGLLSAAGMLAVLLSVALAERIAHEYIPPDPEEDLALGATTEDGRMAAAIETGEGVVGAPDPRRPPAAGSPVYGGDAHDGQLLKPYRIDPDTRRPEVETYDDPFTPAVTPYKRLHAYDAVNARAELVVLDDTLNAMEIGGAPLDGDDQFYGDVTVELASDGAVRLPSVGPAARVLALRTLPETDLVLLRDSAENWFARAPRSERIRLMLHLAIDRSVFGSPFAEVSWRRLEPLVPPVPPTIRAAGLDVAGSLGISRYEAPHVVLERLVAHFRSFSPSDDTPLASSGVDLYRELTLTQKGVCRHRAYAFVVTALALGLPARMVHNEAHAWVEVHDGQLWHRIDLGGAATRLQYEADGRPVHVPPRDPFPWPLSSHSGQGLADQARSRSAQQRVRSGEDGPPVPAPPGGEESEVARPTSSADPRPGAELTLAVGEPAVRRGGRLPVQGAVVADGAPCGQVRVDVFLREKLAEAVGSAGAREARSELIQLGTLVTDEEGRYDGRVVIPYGAAVGDYDVLVSTPGDSRCGRGQTP